MKNILFLVLIIASTGFTQNYLHVDNKNIVDANGDNVILRGMGLGNWMIQEGYMMKTSEFANAHYQIKNKISLLVGQEKTDEFYQAWLENYIQKVDVDSMKAWGFNCIRMPMHYNLYTLPIQNEPLNNFNTWLDVGFELTDRLLQWCAENEIYLVLDMHAAPGGQGYESGISDYNPSYPSLWESEKNQNKLVALWQKLAERYTDEPWIGGYDLINETNWNMNNNKPLKDLSVAITNAIREVDQNHIIFIEGNWFANDFTGMTPPWDDNMVYSFHKYWSYNDQASIQWMLDMRDTYNIPIWCGEAGENSNVWFTDAIQLMEEHNIGWAWWPYKKIDEIDGPVSVHRTSAYNKLLNYWGGSSSKPSQDEAFNTLMELTEQLKLENCKIQPDVLDAMFRQINSNASIPFTDHSVPGLIFATDYDLGRNYYAYWDNQVATYHVSNDNYTAWNEGWVYRNDGVDIQTCDDSPVSNSYNLGWVADDEWLTYTVKIQETAAYDVTFRIASANSAKIHLELDGRPVSKVVTLSSTGGWQSWKSVTVPDIILEQGEHVLKLYFDAASANLNYIEIDNPSSTSDPDLVLLAAAIADEGNAVLASFNKKLNSPLPFVPGGFTLKTTTNLKIDSYEIDDSGYQILFNLQDPLYFEDQVTLSYSGSKINSEDGKTLQSFSNVSIKNTLEDRLAIPGLVEAEDFENNEGFELETTSDTGGGQNLGYADVGDYTDYLVTIATGGVYHIDYRTASESSSGGIELQLINEGGIQTVHRVTFPITGGWQTWKTSTHEAQLPKGRFTLRIKVFRGQFNLNWLKFNLITSDEEPDIKPEQFELAQNYPNPFNSSTAISYHLPQAGQVTLKIYDLRGRLVETLVNGIKDTGAYETLFNASELPTGAYYYQLKSGKYSSTKKMLHLR